MDSERTYIVTYDIANRKRWRRVFRTMQGFGDWLQLSVFQCRLSRRRRVQLDAALREAIKPGEDHVLIIDIGPADRTNLVINSMGKSFKPIQREAIVI